MSKDFVFIIVVIFLIGFIISAIVRMYFHYKEVREFERYNYEMHEKINRLNKQMNIQTSNLAETMAIINNDYNRMINKMKYDDYQEGGTLKVEMDKMFNAQSDSESEQN